ncbi:hypothetical protein UFOVP1247_212 [uncultured Caudovirales phage]|uniref:Uncharacterized protein n=1 Tax=uncultured Caudovirales phage TaxID=2100421 RepID=A0A6J5RJR4_9CAUD|nr:hypothetical protein UFOVP970_252 [uncultured Caudovirales phage]CAB4193841.1 hypothetical protein UFOVP1247_212 [uncultured Caudovirales phage]
MAFSQVVKTHIQPSIKLVTLSDSDNSSDSKTPSNNKQSKNAQDFSQKAGVNTPYIKLGGQVITKIDYLVIDESGFIPTINLTFTDESGEFAGNYFPKRNLLVSIFINSGSDKLKPVKSDYLITSIKSIPVKNRGAIITLSKGTTYIISAELFVPRLYSNVSKSYPNMTSVDAIKAVCSDLGLGYAQNEFNVNDSMTWININTSPSNFLREISNYSYQDDTSFFTSFISKELIMTMVNVNEQLKQLESAETFMVTSDPLAVNLTQKQKDDPEKAALDESTMVNCLTNMRKNAKQANFIYEAHLISDQGSILKKEGYKKKIYYYDHLEESKTKFKSFYAAPLNTEGNNDASMLIPDDEGMDEIGNKKWMNINYGNTHEHWNAARVFNSHNLKELEKIKLKVLLKGVNFQVIRGMAIPVLLTTSMGEKIRRESNAELEVDANPDKQEINEETLDSQLTGWYYVKSATYVFDPTDHHQFSTELVLSRREWSPSKIKSTANA